MLHGNFVFLSSSECEIHISNALFSDRDGSVRKVKLERKSYTAVDILTSFLKLPLVSCGNISSENPTMNEANNHNPSTANKKGAES